MKSDMKSGSRLCTESDGSRGASRVGAIVAVAALVAGGLGLAGCEQEPVDEPRGGGYVAETPRKAESSAATGEGEPAAKSTLGKAKQAAEKVINEDVAEYNKKLEQAADDVYKKGK
jgi:hypothetical protein